MGEDKKTLEPVVSLGTLLLIAIGGRLLFNSLLVGIPSTEPVLPTALLTGILYGSGAGALVGFLGYALSNLFLGSIGDWVVWQGLGGIIAGYVGARSNRDNYIANVVLVTIAFEIIINVYGAGYQIETAYFFSSIVFSITHIATNVLFASLFRSLWLKEEETPKK
ncbi:MAG: ECF transporter S component [Candidatus Diapherotrites archaeon]|nr:ECF transporter S component [Candidatus Diapherotrites archaeon]